MRALIAAVTLVAGCVAASGAVAAGKGDIVLNLRVSDVAPTGADPVTTLTGTPTGLSAKVSDRVMPTLGLSYFLSDHVAVEVIATTTRHTVRAQGPATDIAVKKTWVLPPVASLQYHFAPDARVNPYVGVGVNYMLFHSGGDKSGVHFKIKDGFGTALQAGLDISVRENWSFNADVKKVFFDTTATDRAAGLKAKVTLDPWVISAGFGRRF